MGADTFQSTNARAYFAPGVVGGWASANPHVSMLQPNFGDLSDGTSGSWRVGTTGAIIGNFAFADTTTGLVTNAHPGTGTNFVPGNSGSAGRVRLGFVQRDQVSLITPYLDGDTLALFGGQVITLLTRGDVWAKFAAGAAVGSFVFASFQDGSCVAGSSTTAPTTTISVTTASGSPNLTAVGAGAYAGQPITGTGIPANTYLVSVNATAGTAVMSANATASATITATITTAILTEFRVDSVAASGDISKISVWG